MLKDKKYERLLQLILVVGVILINIKRIFVDFSIDAEYAVTMSYRMAQGDHMFSEMWEPHQTSAFLNTLFIKLWLTITGTTTGLVIYLNIIGVIAKIGVNFFLYYTLKKYSDSKILFYISVFFLATSVKGFVMLEHSNMQLYFSILLFCSLFRFVQNQAKNIWLALSAFFLCLEVLAYPTCVIIFFISVGILLSTTKRRIRNTLVFTGICSLIGSAYLLYFGMKIGFSKFLFCIRQIVSGDTSHSTSILERFCNYGGELLNVMLLYMICAGVAILISHIIWMLVSSKSCESNKRVPTHVVIAIFFALLTIYSVKNIFTLHYEFSFIEIYLPTMFLALCLLKYCNSAEKAAIKLGMLISWGALSATLLLTNLTFFTSLSYMLLGVMLSFIPIQRYLQNALQCNQKIKIAYFSEFVICLITFLFKCIYLVVPMTEYYVSIFDVCNVVKSGPAIGIFSNYIGPHVMNCNFQEWSEHVKPGDNILLVSGSGEISTLEYLFEDINICVDSTICTPTFSDKLLNYWELNPSKVPNVVIVDCWFGELRVSEDSWIMQWVDREFGADSYTNGTYLRFYRR